MIKIGLTGSIATGKSTVSDIFKALELPVIDADLVARQVVERPSNTLQKLIETFGSQIVDDQGDLNRQKLGGIVFGNQYELDRLNAIMHPAIRRAMQAEIKKHEMAHEQLIVLDIPLLIERHYQSQIDELVVVATDQKTQLARLQSRNNLSKADAQKRIDSQMSIDEKVKLADYVIDNNGDVGDTKEQVLAVLQKIKEKYHIL